MKKLLVGTAAVALGFGLAAPAHAAKDGLQLGVGGYFMGYVSWLDQEEQTNPDLSTDGSLEDVRAFDIQRETEVHLTGETTLDNGLTVGMHFEMEADGFSGGAGDSFDVEESYAYFSGAWGRVNFGSEDGAAFLLQVAAPSADANIDGIRQQVQPVNLLATDIGAIGTAFNTAYVAAGGNALNVTNLRFDYDNNPARSDNKITYMTPVFNGFQFGASYTPDQGSARNDWTPGNAFDDQVDDYGEVWEAAARYEGQIGDVGVALGGGYTHVNLEDENAVDGANGLLDDNARWDAGMDLNWGAFGIGAAYLENDHGTDADGDERVWVIGADYTTGPFKLGASYYDNSQSLDALYGAGSGDFDVERWTAGVTYTYGPGMTFRGSVGYVAGEIDQATATAAEVALGAAAGSFENDYDATYVMLGTQINF